MTRHRTAAEIMEEKDGKPSANGPAAGPAVETFTLAELLSMDLPEPAWAVPGVLPQGLVLLAGKPKLGKSWAALGIALAVGYGGKALGAVDVEPGRVLYLALEDSKRRLKKRAEHVCRGDARRYKLTLARAWPRQDRGGLEALRAFLEAHRDTKLVIIDTWQKFRPPKLRGGSDYEQDYAHAAEVKALADEFDVCILVIHHCKKAAELDPFDEVSGTLGLNGCADGVLVLRRERGQHDACLHVTGRDVEERELALTWAPAECLWSIAGDAEEFRISRERADVLALLKREGPLSPSQAAPLLGKNVPAAKKLLWEMSKAGQLTPVGGGKYSLKG